MTKRNQNRNTDQKIHIMLIFVLLTQMGCSVVHTTVGTFLGTLSADVVKDELDKDEDEDKKVKP